MCASRAAMRLLGCESTLEGWVVVIAALLGADWWWMEGWRALLYSKRSTFDENHESTLAPRARAAAARFARAAPQPARADEGGDPRGASAGRAAAAGDAGARGATRRVPQHGRDRVRASAERGLSRRPARRRHLRRRHAGAPAAPAAVGGRAGPEAAAVLAPARRADGRERRQRSLRLSPRARRQQRISLSRLEAPLGAGAARALAHP